MAGNLPSLVGEAVAIVQKCMQKAWFSKVLLTCKSTWLCIKYPFLYPRNRWTGLHYNNWTIKEWIKTLYSKYHVTHKKEIHPTKVYYYNKYAYFESYWTNWWALPLTKILAWIEKYPMQWCHCLTSYTELDALPKTWKDDFGLEWAKDVKQYLNAHNIKHYRISQLKEKWGEFDWLYPPDFAGAMDIETKYVNRSKAICFCCGKPSTKVTPIETYRLFYCDKCAPDYAEPITKNNN